jgi:hypothetical protein
VRDFKEPHYTGPECVCCKKSKKDDIEMEELWSRLVQSVVEREHERLIKKFEEADSACSDWAIAIIKGEDSE